MERYDRVNCWQTVRNGGEFPGCRTVQRGGRARGIRCLMSPEERHWIRVRRIAADVCPLPVRRGIPSSLNLPRRSGAPEKSVRAATGRLRAVRGRAAQYRRAGDRTLPSLRLPTAGTESQRLGGEYADGIRERKIKKGKSSKGHFRNTNRLGGLYGRFWTATARCFHSPWLS